MIVYKRDLHVDDLDNLKDNEELIYYKSNEVAITIQIVGKKFLVRKKQVSDGRLIEESFLKTINEVIVNVQSPTC